MRLKMRIRIMVKKAWQYSRLDKSVTIRFKKIGNLGEYLAGKLLQESGFKNIKDLNKEESANTKDFDFIAERNNIKYSLNLLIKRIAIIIANFKRICRLVDCITRTPTPFES